MKNKVNKILIYLIILLASIIGSYIIFINGYPTGDDINYHFANILDRYDSLISGNYSDISSNLIYGLGSGNRLFYSPLSHTFVALLYIFVKWIGISLIGSLKISFVIFVFVSGIFMYQFISKITNKNKVASLIASLFFVLFPYRMFDAFCRTAIAEAFSFTFLPLFFLGLYEITHLEDNKVEVSSYFKIIISSVLMYLTHNISSLYMFSFGVIYLLFNIKAIIKNFKVKNYILYSSVSVLFILGILSYKLVTQFELVNLGIYNISNKDRMWTSLSCVINRTKEADGYSGFINFIYLKSFYESNFDKSKVIISLILFVFGVFFSAIFTQILKNEIKKKWISYIAGFLILIGVVSIYGRLLEVYLASVIFYLTYMLVDLLDNSDKNNRKIYKDSMFYFVCFSSLIIVISFNSETFWKLVPELFLNIQFPWRNWSLMSLFISIFVGLIVYYYNTSKILKVMCCFLMALFVVVSEPLIEKRMLNTYYPYYYVNEITKEYYYKGSASGHNKEYLPKVLFDNSHTPTYSNSLWYELVNILNYNLDEKLDGTYSYKILSGDSEINNIVKEQSDYYFTINASSDSYIQMPIIYYPGYKITIKDSNGNKIKVDSLNEDGFVAFNVSKGQYDVSISYVGTTSMIIFKVISIISGSSLLLIGSYFYIKKKKLLSRNK